MTDAERIEIPLKVIDEWADHDANRMLRVTSPYPMIREVETLVDGKWVDAAPFYSRLALVNAFGKRIEALKLNR